MMQLKFSSFLLSLLFSPLLLSNPLARCFRFFYFTAPLIKSQCSRQHLNTAQIQKIQQNQHQNAIQDFYPPRKNIIRKSLHDLSAPNPNFYHQLPSHQLPSIFLATQSSSNPLISLSPLLPTHPQSSTPTSKLMHNQLILPMALQ